MQSELQTALFQAFDTLNLQRVKTFSVPPVTLCGPGAVSSCGQQAQTRGLKHLFVMADSFLHQAGMTAGLTRSLAVKGIAMTLWPCPVGELHARRKYGSLRGNLYQRPAAYRFDPQRAGTDRPAAHRHQRAPCVTELIKRITYKAPIFGAFLCVIHITLSFLVVFNKMVVG